MGNGEANPEVELSNDELDQEYINMTKATGLGYEAESNLQIAYIFRILTLI